jgi:integrase
VGSIKVRDAALSSDIVLIVVHQLPKERSSESATDRSTETITPAVRKDMEGFHAFRRFRATHLDLSDVPRGIAQFWLGHADKNITDRYVKAGKDKGTADLGGEDGTRIQAA